MTEKQFYKKGGTENLQMIWKQGNKRRHRVPGELGRAPEVHVRWSVGGSIGESHFLEEAGPLLKDRKELTGPKRRKVSPGSR